MHDCDRETMKQLVREAMQEVIRGEEFKRSVRDPLAEEMPKWLTWICWASFGLACLFSVGGVILVLVWKGANVAVVIGLMAFSAWIISMLALILATYFRSRE